MNGEENGMVFYKVQSFMLPRRNLENCKNPTSGQFVSQLSEEVLRD
jgi:hypothetical protein